MLRPLGKAVIGVPVVIANEPSWLVQPFMPKETPLAIEVRYIGNACKEVKVGDEVLLNPKGGGTFVTLLDENNEPHQFVACDEEDILFITL